MTTTIFLVLLSLYVLVSALFMLRSLRLGKPTHADITDVHMLIALSAIIGFAAVCNSSY